jgi:hypothetical protein
VAEAMIAAAYTRLVAVPLLVSTPARLSIRLRVLPLNQTTLCWHTSSSHKQAVELSSEHPVYEFPDSPGLTGLSGRPMSLRG